MVALCTLLLVLALSMVMTRIATVALRATGLSGDAARFQARSALSGVGFTTQESEAILRQPVRREIISLLMLVGSAGTVTLIASLLLTFVGTSGFLQPAFRAAVLVLGLLLLWWAATSTWLDHWMSAVIERALRRWTSIDVRDYADLLGVSGDYKVVELSVDPEDWVADRPLDALDLPDEGTIVLGIYRSNGGYIGAPTGSTLVRPGDTLVLYGRRQVLSTLGDRPKGNTGDVAHEEAVAEQRQVIEREQQAANATARAHD
jgi:hypothetical protein